MTTIDPVDRAVEDVMATSYDRLVAYLARLAGDLGAAEDALGDALAAAVVTWRDQGVPQRPESWLITVSRRRLIGAARRRATADRAEPSLRIRASELADDDPVGPIPDRRLELLYVCAHPAIAPTVRAPLMLQAVLRLDAARIAGAFVTSPATMGQRLSRAKAKIRDARIPFEVPDPAELPGRTRHVLDAIYAAYGTGWDDPGGADPKRRGLTAEAERLGRLVVELQPGDAEAHGLLALMLHTEARADARRDGDRYIPLDEQDMSRWSSASMLDAEHHLERAFALGRLGPYQIHATIQSVHNRRALTGATDWTTIATLYDGLVAHAPGVGAEVARAAAHSHSSGPAFALDLLDAMPADRVSDYQPYWAARAHVLDALGRDDDARSAASRAIGMTTDPAVRSYLVARHRAPLGRAGEGPVT